MTCNHLVPAAKIQAFYSNADKTLTVSAEVTFRPGDFGIEICRSLLDPTQSPTPAFTVAAPAPSKIEPQIIYIKTISETFPMDKAPRAILVYSAGVDGPTWSEIALGDAPPLIPLVATAPPPAAAPVAGAAVVAKQATGWSRTYDYEEALASAVRQLRANSPVGNPDKLSLRGAQEVVALLDDEAKAKVTLASVTATQEDRDAASNTIARVQGTIGEAVKILDLAEPAVRETLIQVSDDPYSRFLVAVWH